ncbi:hypothetical protein PanWU01x14_150250 [Parasponia andersonii]|uniref:Uncharacterized protein n=1 Tax=Parasponia andersonii TaxID=3476 RepID=A0A2P5CIL3_PARAD|nr:hypothetical protein PanWU01x14_150250 [Parasponia andersonii]
MTTQEMIAQQQGIIEAQVSQKAYMQRILSSLVLDVNMPRIAPIYLWCTLTAFGMMPPPLPLTPHFAPPPSQPTRQKDENEETKDEDLGLQTCF